MSRLRAGRHVGTVTWGQRWELVYDWGGQHRADVIHEGGACDGIGCWSEFDSDESRQAAWWALRDEVLHALNPGQRPAAYWHYEAGSLCTHEPRCPKWPADELAWLLAHDQASPRERALARASG
jgi:hypothetical protein